jgi:hypothetical protein
MVSIRNWSLIPEKNSLFALLLLLIASFRFLLITSSISSLDALLGCTKLSLLESLSPSVCIGLSFHSACFTARLGSNTFFDGPALHSISKRLE